MLSSLIILITFLVLINNVVSFTSIMKSSSSSLSCYRSKNILNMVATAPSKQANLLKVKNRYEGREDIAGMLDNDDDLDSYRNFEEADAENTEPPKTGNTITGTIIDMDDNGALLEIGGKMSGYLPIKEASLITIKHMRDVFEIGQQITAEVIGTLKGMPVISLRSAQLVTAWGNVLNIRAADTPFDVKVLEVNKGGAICDAMGLKAFLPGSHFLGIPDESLIGTTIKVKFLDVNEDDGKIVVSQRRAMTESQTALKRGEVVQGTITGLRAYGAFLELDGGVAGLLHISQISYGRVENPETLFTIGQRCKVMILDFDKANGRVALSTKVLEPNPGDMLRDMPSVFDKAEETAKKYHERLEAERLAREAAAKDIVAGLGGAIADPDSDPLLSVADSIESILASVVSDVNKDNSSA